MHKTIQESCAFVKHLMEIWTKTQVKVGLAVPFTALSTIAAIVRQHKLPLWLGAQNMSEHEEGAYTGEISANMLVEAGAEFVLLGHSERRHLFHETSDLVNRKVKHALQKNLTPIVCIGETEKEREQGKTEEVLAEQIALSLADLEDSQIDRVILAYEPVWAIGTGKVATPEDANETQRWIRRFFASQWGELRASKLVIQYGGSVKPENAAKLLAESEIDGLLVGGASLDPNMFEKLITTG